MYWTEDTLKWFMALPPGEKPAVPMTLGDSTFQMEWKDVEQLLTPSYPARVADVLKLYDLLECGLTKEQKGKKIQDFFPQLKQVSAYGVMTSLDKLKEKQKRLTRFDATSEVQKQKLAEFLEGRWKMEVSAFWSKVSPSECEFFQPANSF